MSWQASAWALKTRVGDPVLKILLMAIANYADPNGACYVKTETLAYDSEVSKRTIQRSLAKLAELGLIKITPRFNAAGKQMSSRFNLMMPELVREELPAESSTMLEKLRSKLNGTRGDKSRGDKLAPYDSDTGRVTPRCHGEGDNKVSPTESLERSYERSIKQDSLSSHSLGCAESGSEFKLEPCEATHVVSRKEETELFFDNEFWPAYPKRFGRNPKEPAKKKIVAAILKGEKPSEILDGVKKLYAGLQRTGKIGTQYVPMAVTWINGRGWKDDPMPSGNGWQKPQSFLEAAEDLWSGGHG